MPVSLITFGGLSLDKPGSHARVASQNRRVTVFLDDNREDFQKTIEGNTRWHVVLVNLQSADVDSVEAEIETDDFFPLVFGSFNDEVFLSSASILYDQDNDVGRADLILIPLTGATITFTVTVETMGNEYGIVAGDEPGQFWFRSDATLTALSVPTGASFLDTGFTDTVADSDGTTSTISLYELTGDGPFGLQAAF